MSFVRSLLSLILSFLFVTLLFTAITSYTIGSLLEKENLKAFINSDIAPEIVENQCNWLCESKLINKEQCIQECLSGSLGLTDGAVGNSLDDFYESEIFGMTIDELTKLMAELYLFSILTILSGLFLYAVTEEKDRINTFSRSFVGTGLALIVSGYSPQIIFGSSLEGIPIVGDLYTYLTYGLNIQLKIGVAFLVIGGLLFIIDRSKNPE